jgi:hypothetical protein
MTTKRKWLVGALVLGGVLLFLIGAGLGSQIIQWISVGVAGLGSLLGNGNYKRSGSGSDAGRPDKVGPSIVASETDASRATEQNIQLTGENLGAEGIAIQLGDLASATVGDAAIIGIRLDEAQSGVREAAGILEEARKRSGSDPAVGVHKY